MLKNSKRKRGFFFKVDVFVAIWMLFCRTGDSVVAKMNVLFDKAAYEKGRTLETEVRSNDLNESEEEMREGKLVKRALLDSVTTGKVGSLSVDPNYLDFEPVECNFAFSSFSIL